MSGPGKGYQVQLCPLWRSYFAPVDDNDPSRGRKWRLGLPVEHSHNKGCNEQHCAEPALKVQRGSVFVDHHIAIWVEPTICLEHRTVIATAPVHSETSTLIHLSSDWVIVDELLCTLLSESIVAPSGRSRCVREGILGLPTRRVLFKVIRER